MYIKVIYVIAIICGLVSCSLQQIEENFNPSLHAIEIIDLKAIAEKMLFMFLKVNRTNGEKY